MIITIIVLLILAGVSIATLTGQNGILTQANESKEKTEKAEIIERAKTDLIGKQAENQSGDVTRVDLKTVLDKYFKDVPDDYTQDTLLTAKEEYGNYQILVSDIYNGEVILLDRTVEVSLDKKSITKEIESGSTAIETLTATLNNATGDLIWETSDAEVATINETENKDTKEIILMKAGKATITVSYGTVSATCDIIVTEKSIQKTYKIGDKVTVRNNSAGKDETFYVITDSNETQENVTLLAFENIDTKNYVQSSDAEPIAFSKEPYWGEEKNIIEGEDIPSEHYAAYAAYVYGEKIGGSGKLMTEDKANSLIDNGYDYIIYGTEAQNTLYYWLGSAISSEYVCCVNGGTHGSLSTDEYWLDIYRVRPVVEISKDKVSLVQ